MNPDSIQPSQPPQHPPHHVSPSMKFVMLLFGLALVAVLGYFTWYVGGEQEVTEENAPKVKKDVTTQETKTETADNQIACGDKAYAFELTLDPIIWKNYKIKEVKSSDAVIYCYFQMPSDDKDAQAATTTSDAGYVSLFAVSVYTPAQWALVNVPEGNPPTELGHNNNYYWSWSPAQWYPDALQAVSSDVKNVVATFKIAP